MCVNQIQNMYQGSNVHYYSIVSDNGVGPTRGQAIISTNDG